MSFGDLQKWGSPVIQLYRTCCGGTACNVLLKLVPNTFVFLVSGQTKCVEGIMRRYQTHLKENSDHPLLCDAPIVVGLPFLIVEYFDRCPAYFDVMQFCRMNTNGNELQGHECSDKVLDPSVSGWSNRGDCCGCCRGLDCHYAGNETDSPLVRCPEEAVNQWWLVERRLCMPE